LFPCKQFVLPEISRGGRDLFSTDGVVSVQARLIYDFRQFRPLGAWDALALQFKALSRKLRQDAAHNPAMTNGIASLSYFLDGKLQTIVSVSKASPRAPKECVRDSK
jgi:hypothetical protein